MIDGGPLRTSRPTGREVAYRNESVRQQPEQYQPEEPAMPVESPRQIQSNRQVEPERIEVAAVTEKPKKSIAWAKWLVVPLLVLLVAAAGWFLWPSNDQSLATTIDTNKYQAVFLSNGQVYFGRLSVVNSDYMKLTNVFYLERQLTATTGTEGDTNPTANPSGDNNFQLLKYSDVLYGSEDEMIISKDDIIRYENLRSDGVVAKAIANRR